MNLLSDNCSFNRFLSSPLIQCNMRVNKQSFDYARERAHIHMKAPQVGTMTGSAQSAGAHVRTKSMDLSQATSLLNLRPTTNDTFKQHSRICIRQLDLQWILLPTKPRNPSVTPLVRH